MTGEEMELKKRLKQYQVPAPDRKRKEKTRALLQDMRQPCRMTDRQFILGQIGFIRPHTWIGQLAVFVVICMILYGLLEIGYRDYRILSVVSAMTPMLLVFHIEEFAKICYKSMLEIEMATKYSLKKLVLSRMCILGTADLLVLGGFVTFLNIYLDESLFGILLYSLVPFNLTVIGLIYLLKYAGKGMYGYQALAYTGCVCVCFVMIAFYRPLVYSRENKDMWLLVCIASLLVLVKVIREVWKDVVYCEGLLAAEG